MKDNLNEILKYSKEFSYCINKKGKGQEKCKTCKISSHIKESVPCRVYDIIQFLNLNSNNKYFVTCYDESLDENPYYINNKQIILSIKDIIKLNNLKKL